MIIHYFRKKENKDKEIANKIYLSIIEQVKKIFNKKEFNLIRDFNSSFELITIFLFIIFFAYKKESKELKINQYLMNLYIIDLDKSLREMGIGDMGIGKYVKSYVKKFYFRIPKLEKIFQKNDYDSFEKYIRKIDISEQHNNNISMNKYLFALISKSLKSAKREDLTQFTFKNLSI